MISLCPMMAHRKLMMSIAPCYNLRHLTATLLNLALARCESHEARSSILFFCDLSLNANSPYIYGEEPCGVVSPSTLYQQDVDGNLFVADKDLSPDTDDNSDCMDNDSSSGTTTIDHDSPEHDPNANVDGNPDGDDMDPLLLNSSSYRALMTGGIKVMDLKSYITPMQMCSSRHWNPSHPCPPHDNHDSNQKCDHEYHAMMATTFVYLDDKKIQDILDLKQWIACRVYMKQLEMVRVRRPIWERKEKAQERNGKKFRFAGIDKDMKRKEGCEGKS
ncbi:hypothetical protein BZA77DRAFT_355161 [Pyronema omphalodes]|nr:hypothetical protein BZA77DRAFT_355161 [Pyronema omphalodes]